MQTPVYHSIMSMKIEYPKLKSPGFIGKKTNTPLWVPVTNMTGLSQNETLCYISGTRMYRILIFSVNNYEGARSITLKKYNDNSIRMGM